MGNPKTVTTADRWFVNTYRGKSFHNVLEICFRVFFFAARIVIERITLALAATAAMFMPVGVIAVDVDVDVDVGMDLDLDTAVVIVVRIELLLDHSSNVFLRTFPMICFYCYSLCCYRMIIIILVLALFSLC